jgi:GTP-binding protein
MSKKAQNKDIRNIAIIAHVDHGKTTLVDAMFKQSGLFREGQEIETRLMDNLELEKERGITIAAKNCSVVWKGIKINIIDTPGHAEFGGEVERALAMADGALLLGDSSEGPLPQTRFVLKKTFEAGLKVIVVVNKIDRQHTRPQEVLNEIYDLFIELGANDEQIEFPLLYAIGREGIAKKKLTDRSDNLDVLFETIIEKTPPPTYDPKEPFQMLVADLGYSAYMGRLAIGRVINGYVNFNDSLVCMGEGGEETPLKVTKIQVYEGITLKEVNQAGPGDIVVLSGIDNVKIGDTICNREFPKALKRITVEEPTVSMRFTINTSPLAGKEGKFVQSSKIKERLFKETLRNVAIRVDESEDRDSFNVKGRGEFQLAILIETMRREGYEFCVGRPEVILKEKDGRKQEPIEHLYIDADETFMGIITENLPRERVR